MDVRTYATLTDVCGWLAGRLSDTVLDAVRVNYYVGEDVMAESAMLLGLAMENVGITPEEREQIRSVLDDPDNPDLDDVPSIAEVPPLAYRFATSPPPGPVTAPDPYRADEVLAAEAPNHQGRRVRRTWRTPLTDPDRGTWLYVVQIAPGGNVLRAYSGLSSTLNVEARLTWPVEVVTEGSLLPPYQAAALTAAHQVWAA
jgi:hypothetical protein